MFRLVLVGLLLAFAGFSAPAQSATYRYSFDVVASNFSFIDFLKLEQGDPTGVISWQPGEYEYYMRKYHPLGSVYELGGKVVMDLHASDSDDPWPSGTTGSVSCVSGFLCLLDPVSFFMEIYSDFTSTRLSTSVGSIIAYSLNETYGFDMLDFGDPLSSGTYPCDFEPNCVVDYWAASAYFTLANSSRVEITPVPLPAGAPLLAMGLMALGIGARRHCQPA